MPVGVDFVGPAVRGKSGHGGKLVWSRWTGVSVVAVFWSDMVIIYNVRVSGRSVCSDRAVRICTRLLVRGFCISL